MPFYENVFVARQAGVGSSAVPDVVTPQYVQMSVHGNAVYYGDKYNKSFDYNRKNLRVSCFFRL